jgi:sulfite exporter TauE/SafE
MSQPKGRASTDSVTETPGEKAGASAARPGAIVIKVEPGALLGLVVIAAIGLLFGLWSAGALHLPEVPQVDANASLWLIFITGLTAGGLSCLAVQGGLLATTIAQREQRFIEDHVEDKVKTSDHAAPILLFLAAKLAAYTLLGALLGLLGSFISLSPTMRGVFQIAIGLFMFGVAMQMLNVHPVFRYFALEPPKRAQRLIRKHAKRDDALTPLFLGALTVLIPCGVTQAMMLVAMATGSATRGALVMFAFVLGTTPVFFVLGLLATRLSAAMHGAFIKLAAGTIAVLAVLSIITGYRLLPIAGGTTTGAAASPATTSSVSVDPASAVAPAQAPGQTIAAAPAGAEATIKVLAHGYDPPVVQVKAGMPAKIHLVTDNLNSCTRSFVIPALNVERMLPYSGTETIDLPASPPGQIAYTCGMGMYSGTIEVVQ